MTIGGILILALIVAVIVIYVKVKSNSKKIGELDEILEKHER